MKNLLLVLSLLSLSIITNAQLINKTPGFFFAKEYGREFAAYYSKLYLYQEILNSPPGISKFSIDIISAANSGELTTLTYGLDDLNKKGLIIGFFGNYINENGVQYLGYRYLNFDQPEAIEFLNLIQSTLNQNQEYLGQSPETNNVAFNYKGMTVVISNEFPGYKIRLFWGSFDCLWNIESFERTRTRFSKFLKK
jgi:hypothetical protein